MHWLSLAANRITLNLVLEDRITMLSGEFDSCIACYYRQTSLSGKKIVSKSTEILETFLINPPQKNRRVKLSG